jgi:hypothetical protein
MEAHRSEPFIPSDSLEEKVQLFFSELKIPALKMGPSKWDPPSKLCGTYR